MTKLEELRAAAATAYVAYKAEWKKSEENSNDY
jgi:hypothetical protein